MAEEQNYANHVRRYPLVHFVILPLLVINLLCHLVRFVMTPGWDRGFWAILSLVLVLMAFAARLQALRSQDRTIRLEERLRYREVLSADLCREAANLRTGQIIALRFAGDEELPHLIRRVLDGELNTGKEIKMAIQHWRPDHLRV